MRRIADRKLLETDGVSKQITLEGEQTLRDIKKSEE
jgi:hypothetical protein